MELDHVGWATPLLGEISEEISDRLHAFLPT